MTQITYNDFIQYFDSEEWDIGYLYGNEMTEVLNHPIKYNTNLIEWVLKNPPFFLPDDIFLVVVKQNYDYNYTHLKQFQDVCNLNFPDLDFTYIEPCNLKYAAVRAGLGRYAKNSLFYHNKFKFETHLAVAYVGKQIIDLPERNQYNLNVLELCSNCNDCIKACPAQAIHFDQGLNWIDLQACDNFCHFGNDKKIPSLKWSLVKFCKSISHLKYDEIYNIHNFPQWIEILNKENVSELEISPMTSYMHFPICRECTSQKRCSKYEGKYPYDWNACEVIMKEVE